MCSFATTYAIPSENRDIPATQEGSLVFCQPYKLIKTREYIYYLHVDPANISRQIKKMVNVGTPDGPAYLTKVCDSCYTDIINHGGSLRRTKKPKVAPQGTIY